MKMAECIYEIRDYTIEAEWFEAYDTWAREIAVPWLAANFDLLGFWLNGGLDAVVGGSNPMVSSNGQPNVTWILRWPDKATRDEQFPKIMGSDEWKAIWAKHPNANSYLHANARFMEAVE